jgi:hypothetical protein
MRYRFNPIVPVWLMVVSLGIPWARAETGFEPFVVVDEGNLPLIGSATLSRYFIKGCDIALYSTHQGVGSVLSEEVPRCLEFYYYRDVSADQLSQAAWKILNEAWPPNVLAEHQEAINRLNALYKPVGKGDRYRLLYVPGHGVELILNGKSLGKVPGDDMASIYFSIWLGEKPLDHDLRAKLLGE